MITAEQFAAARDITPPFGVITVQTDDGLVHRPMLPGTADNLRVADEQGIYDAPDGSGWLVGTYTNGQLVKRRFR